MLRNGCSIDVMNPNSNDEQDLIKDLVSVITSFCCRLYSLRRTKKKVQQIKDLLMILFTVYFHQFLVYESFFNNFDRNYFVFSSRHIISFKPCNIWKSIEKSNCNNFFIFLQSIPHNHFLWLMDQLMDLLMDILMDSEMDSEMEFLMDSEMDSKMDSSMDSEMDSKMDSSMDM